jgi:hypothetical protein
MPNTRILWLIWLGLALAATAVLATALTSSPAMFQSGELSDGHHQFGVTCSACHTEPFGGTEVIEKACRDCHQADLAHADDSHPDRKFTDPRNASLLDRIDARKCVTCHTEHRPERTHGTGVSIPKNFCIECHVDVASERPTHQGASFKTCAGAGCHNFHDNRALYETFLERHMDQPPLLESPLRLSRREYPSEQTLTESDADGELPHDNTILSEWAQSAHARGDVNCRDCHAPTGEWRDHVEKSVCAECHEQEKDGFIKGRHGMRSAVAEKTLLLADARLPMKADAMGRRPGCNQCHSAHDYDTRRAAARSCLECHDDEHSRNWRDSPHGQLWQSELDGRAPKGSGVACASCHMPRQEHRGMVTVEHNQNAFLRPVETMGRKVCMQCHGLPFSLNSLADDELLKNNFQGAPSVQVESFDWVRERLERSD